MKYFHNTKNYIPSILWQLYATFETDHRWKLVIYILATPLHCELWTLFTFTFLHLEVKKKYCMGDSSDFEFWVSRLIFFLFPFKAFFWTRGFYLTTSKLTPSLVFYDLAVKSGDATSRITPTPKAFGSDCAKPVSQMTRSTTCIMSQAINLKISQFLSASIASRFYRSLLSSSSLLSSLTIWLSD